MSLSSFDSFSVSLLETHGLKAPNCKRKNSFLQLCLGLAEDYRRGILNHAPLTEAQHADQRILLKMADAMFQLSHLACSILTKRDQYR